MGSEVINMDAFKNAKPAMAFAAVEVESLADGIGSSYGVIGYKGKVWTLRYRGEKHVFVRPDDGTPAGSIDVIILRQAHAKSKSFYEGYDPNASDGKRPICSSLDGVMPDDDDVTKQSTACAICPRNVWKTNAEGKKSRECTDYKRLAVLLLPAQTKALLGQSLMEPVFLRVPPASLNDLAVFGETMSKQGWPFQAFVTRISFDPNEPHPKMVFRPLQALTDAEAPVVLPLTQDQMTLRITGDDKQPLHEAPRLTNGNPVAQIATAAAPPPKTEPAPATTVLPPQPEPVAQAPMPHPASTGLLELTANPQPAVAPTPVAQVQAPADVGEPAQSDAALDDKIASLLKV